ncbi:MAG: beta-galactosidase, partial [bacterium]|nr:beta-galactosidase [bacterium]
MKIGRMICVVCLVYWLAAIAAPRASAQPAARPAGQEMLVEDFENGLAGWSANDAFRAAKRNGDVTLTTMSLVAGASGGAGPHGGRHCLQIAWLPGRGWANVYLHSGDMGDRWAALGVDEFAFWMRGDGQDKQVNVSLHTYSDQMRPVTFGVPVSLKDAAWHEVVIPLARFQAADPGTPLRTRAILHLQFDGSGEMAPARIWVDDIRARNARGEGAAFAVLPDADKLAALPPVRGLPRVGTFGLPSQTAGTPAQVKALGLGFTSNGMIAFLESRMYLQDGLATDYTPNRKALLGNQDALAPEDVDQDAQGRPMGEGIRSSVFMPEQIDAYCRREAEAIRLHQGDPWVCSISLVSPVSMYGEHHMAASSAGQYAVFSRPAKENFRRWLKRRYGGNLAALNRAWGMATVDWAQVVPPAGPAASAGHVDTRTAWSDFMHWYNGWSDEVLRRMLAAARPETAKPILIWLGGPKVGPSQGISLGNIGPYTKMLGRFKPAIMNDTDGQSLFSLKYTRAACSQYGVGMMMENVGPPYLQPYHQYNMVLNLLASGADHVRLAHLGEMYGDHWFGKMWRGQAPLLQRYRTAYLKSDAAIFHSYVTSWYRPDRSNKDALQLYDATNTFWLPDKHMPSWGRALGSPDVLDDVMIEDGGLVGRKLLVIPNSSVTLTTRKALDAIRQWVETGGTVVGFGSGCLAWTVEPDRTVRATPLLGGLLPADALADAVANAAAKADPASTAGRVEAAVGRGRAILYATRADPVGEAAFTRAMTPQLTEVARQAGARQWCAVAGNVDQAVNLIYCGKDQASGRHLFALDLMSRCLPQPEFVTDRALELTFDPALAGEAELVSFSGGAVGCQGGAAVYDPETRLLTVRFALPGRLTLKISP